MSVRNSFVLLVILASFVTSASAQTITPAEPKPVSTQAQPISEAAAELPVAPRIVGLSPGDTLDVHFFDFTESPDLHLTIAPDGTIRVPYAGPVKIAGLMPEQAEQAIINALKEKQVVYDPQVSLTVLSSRYLTALILGEVKAPQSIPLYAPATLGLLLTQSGGFTSSASYSVRILHISGADPELVHIDPMLVDVSSLMTPVYPGDVISVQHAQNFFVLGQVNHPGVFPLSGTKHMTLIDALSVAGSTTNLARLSQCRILRTDNGHREEIVIDIAKLTRGEVPDPMVHPDDIVYVPHSFFRVVANSWLYSAIEGFQAYSIVR